MASTRRLFHWASACRAVVDSSRRGTLCEGSGTYQWAIDGDRLTLTPVDDDPCTGRSEVIIGYTYTHV